MCCFSCLSGRGFFFFLLFTGHWLELIQIKFHVCVCIFVCVCEREREREHSTVQIQIIKELSQLAIPMHINKHRLQCLFFHRCNFTTAQPLSYLLGGRGNLEWKNDNIYSVSFSLFFLNGCIKFDITFMA